MDLLQNVLDTLEAKQIPAAIAFPKRKMPRLTESTIMLWPTERRIFSFCHGNLLGLSGTQEVYSLACTEAVVCDIYSPYLSGGYQCDILASTVFNCLCELSGVNASITRTQTYYDPDTDCFRCKILVESDGWVQK